jgi:sugar lactone lactonase YvrE
VGVVVAATLRVRYGGGRPYPDVTSAPLFPDSALEVAAISQEPVGNVAATADGRLFFTIHPESRPSGAKILEWRDGKAVPFPSREIQDARLVTPLALRAGPKNLLWAIDHGNHGLSGARLWAFDLGTGRIVREIRFDRRVAPAGSFLQDFAMDQEGDFAYIADVAFWRQTPAIVVVDLKTGAARRVLEGHPSVMPQDWIIHSGKRMVFFGGLVALKAGIDGIALTADGKWAVFAAMSHEGLFKVPVADLRNETLPFSELSRRVQKSGTKPLSDGITTDTEGNVLITDVEHGAIVRMRPDGSTETVVKSPRIRWADGFSWGTDGWLYLADSAIPDQMLQSKSHMSAHAPYYVYRLKPGTAGIPGR